LPFYGRAGYNPFYFMTPRSEIFRQMAEQQPDNEMVWYGLANEYNKEERWPEAAAALRRVIELKPDYTAAYQLLGTALARLGEVSEARRVWTEGVAVAQHAGAWKAGQHMEGLLADSAGAGTEFCE
jgi:predicted Zn-dependent protease